MNPELLYIFVPIILIIIIIIWPRQIDTVYSKDKTKILFKIYKRDLGFQVRDYTSSFTKKIYFKTYIDVEAYIIRKLLGWSSIS